MDKQTILEKIKRFELGLQDIPEELLSDRSFVLALLEFHPQHLRFVSESLRGDVAFLREVVGSRGQRAWIMRFAPDRFEGSEAFAEELLRTNPSSFYVLTRYLRPTPEVLDAAFGGHDLASLRAHPDDNATDDGERFVDEFDDAQHISSWVPGESRDVGNGVTIQCWHELTEGDHVLKFFVLVFQADAFCLTICGTPWRDPCDPDCAGLTDLLAVFCVEGEISPIGDHQDYFQFLCDLEDPDSLDGYVEEQSNSDHGDR
ncbi:MAG: DUF4116 domain-containing protein [Planctomycetota bacterium]|nr:DUF4116 domain-containing protein [Planctomycetota bacterium]